MGGTGGGGGDTGRTLEGAAEDEEEELLAEPEVADEPRFRTCAVCWWGALNAERRVLLNNKL